MKTHIDISDLNDRLLELTDLRNAVDEAQEALNEADPSDKADALRNLEAAQAEFGEDERVELAALEELRSEVGADGDDISEDAGPLVHESDWEEYCREMLEDCGTIPRDLPWYVEIDWQATAQNIAQDYGRMTWDGSTYYFRNC